MNDMVLIESRSLRDASINRVDVLDKVKIIPYIGKDRVVTVEQTANFYEVSTDAIRKVISRHKDELKTDGLKVLNGKELIDFKAQFQGQGQGLRHGVTNLKNTACLTIISRRALLRIGMLLTESPVAKMVRNYLIEVEAIKQPPQVPVNSMLGFQQVPVTPVYSEHYQSSIHTAQFERELLGVMYASQIIKMGEGKKLDMLYKAFENHNVNTNLLLELPIKKRA